MPYDSRKYVNQEGKMHHLGVAEEDITKTVILVSGPSDVKRLKDNLEEPTLAGNLREYLTYRGTYKGQEVTLMSCGNGCMPMAIACEELAHLHAVNVIKMDGNVAIDKNITLGAVLVAKAAVRGEGASLEYIDASYPAIGDHELTMKLLKNSEPVLYRTHDCLRTESPYAPNGSAKMQYWASLGVKIMDSETSSLFVTGRITGLKTASISFVKENYASGETMSEENRQKHLVSLFKYVLERVL